MLINSRSPVRGFVLGLAPALVAAWAAVATAQPQHPTMHDAESAAKVIAQSNNPLSDLEGINFNEYYAPALSMPMASRTS